MEEKYIKKLQQIKPKTVIKGRCNPSISQLDIKQEEDECYPLTPQPNFINDQQHHESTPSFGKSQKTKDRKSSIIASIKEETIKDAGETINSVSDFFKKKGNQDEAEEST